MNKAYYGTQCGLFQKKEMQKGTAEVSEETQCGLSITGTTKPQKTESPAMSSQHEKNAQKIF